MRKVPRAAVWSWRQLSSRARARMALFVEEEVYTMRRGNGLCTVYRKASKSKSPRKPGVLRNNYITEISIAFMGGLHFPDVSHL